MANEEKKETRTFSIVGPNKVKVHHKTITADNASGIYFDWTLDFTNVSHEQLLKWAADQRVIALRASAGVKKLTTAEIQAKGLQSKEFDLSKTIERAKHVKSEAEQTIETVVKEVLAKNPTMAVADLLKEAERLLRERAAVKEDAEMESGEVTE